MKLLIITYSYSPDLTPRAFRWAAVARELSQAGHEVEVLCASKDQGMFSEEGVVVHRVQDWLLNASARVTAGCVVAGSKQPTGTSAAFKRLLRRSVRTLWKALHWPDYAVGWVIPACVKTRALYKANRYDWVITVSHPFTSHLVGWLSRPKLSGAKWLVDVGDPFFLMSDPSPNNRLLYSWLSELTERRVVAAADAISVTTESTRSLYENFFPEAFGKIVVIPPLLSIPNIPVGPSPEPNAPIRLIFVGSLYKNLRSPRHLLTCFEQLVDLMPERNIELHFYGAINDCGPELDACSLHVRSCLFVHGMVDRHEVVRAMANADVLVNIGNVSESQLASKVIEYMAMGKPILNFVSIDRDTSVAAIGDYPALTVRREFCNAPAALIDVIKQFVTSPPSVSSDYVTQIRRSFSPAHVANQYTSIINTDFN